MEQRIGPAIRVPDDLKQKLKEIAKKEFRTFNQQAIFILAKYVEQYESAKEGCTND